MSTVANAVQFTEVAGVITGTISRVEICLNCKSHKVYIVDKKKPLILAPDWQVPSGVTIDKIVPYWCSACDDDTRFPDD